MSGRFAALELAQSLAQSLANVGARALLGLHAAHSPDNLAVPITDVLSPWIISLAPVQAMRLYKDHKYMNHSMGLWAPGQLCSGRSVM